MSGRRTRDVRKEVQDEIDAHFEGTVELLVRRGWSEEAARAEARLRFGDLTRYRRKLERIGRRRRARARLLGVLQALRGGVQATVRSLRRAPGFSLAVTLTLALGIGANAAVFRVVDGLLLSPPPGIERPSEVRALSQTMASADDGDPYEMRAFTYRDVTALRSSGLPVRLGAFAMGLSETLGEGDGAVQARVARADSALLPLLGVRPALGRGLLPDDHRAGAAPVAVIGHALWESRFGSDPAVLGRALRAGPGTYEIVGVLPEGFIGPAAPATDVWLPLEATAEGLWGPGWRENESILAFHLVARVPEEGLDEAAFATQARDLLRRSRVDYGLRGELQSVSTMSLIPGEQPNLSSRLGDTISVSRWLVGVSLLVLLVACANVANLFLAQGERLRRDTAVRRALGAGRGRLRLELLMRSLTLAVLGAGGAFAFAVWGGGALERIVFQGMDFTAPPRTGRMVLFTGGAACVAAALAGLLPALRAPRGDLRPGLEAGGGRTTTGSRRTRRTLVALQTTFSVLLLVGAGLFVLSFRAAASRDLGFDLGRLVMVRLEQDTVDGPATGALYEQAEATVRALPGVEAAARSVAVPFVLIYGMQAGRPDGSPEEDAPADSLGAEPVAANGVSPGYFATMGVPILRGRAIQEPDLAPGAEPVAVVGRTAAARFWPGADPLGRCLQVGSGERSEPCARVVGVAGEHVVQSITEEVRPTAWIPLTHPAVRPSPSLLVRTRGTPADVLADIRRRVSQLPSVRFAEVEPLSGIAGRQMRSWRLGATVFSLFGLIALGVAGVGLYALLAYDVAQRRREIGIRVALGARGGNVIRHVLTGAFLTVAAGLAAGLGIATWGARLLEPLLFEVSPGNPAVFVLAAGGLLLIGLGASALPAWRATRVDPRESLAVE